MRTLLLATVFAAALSGTAMAEPESVTIPVLRANVTVTSDVVRIGDLVENPGTAAQIAVFRSPDLGTTGSVPTAQLLDALRAHQVIGVDTHDIREVSVTHAARTLAAKDIQLQIARVLEHRNGLGDAADIAVSFDRDIPDLQLEATNSGDLRASKVWFDRRNGRFDVAFDIANDTSSVPTRLRFTGIAIETVEATVLTRSLDRNEVLKASDIAIERRPKIEAGNDAASRERAIGMQVRRPLRAGQVVKIADLGKPDMVSRDQNVTLIYRAPGLYLTGRGKAIDSGTEGDTVNILNLQSKLTIQGVVIGPGQVAVVAPNSRLPRTTTASLASSEMPAGAEAKKAE